MCRSKDRGATWSIPEVVLRYDNRACLLSEVIVHDQEIRIMVVTHLGNFADWRNFVMTSRDNGQTWDDPVPFEPMPRRTFLRNLYISTWGEWFLPFQTYTDAPDLDASPFKDESLRRARNGTLISDDKEKRKVIHEARDSGVDSHQLDFRWYLCLCCGERRCQQSWRRKNGR